MATQNLFEKYGIKEVADVTFYRIEKKEETYESQRKITASSILRGALELRDVYPIVDGAGDEEGFKAYVFVDATINTGVNYDCDDESADASELGTGVFDNDDAYTADEVKEVGTHEFSYAEQICMLFAKRQNIISKTGVRYIFNNADTIFGSIAFDDNFTIAPHSTEKVVVVGLDGKFDEATYDIDEINEVIANLTESIEAKAFDVTYSDYVELVVEDEMGYYNPEFLGYQYDKKNQSITGFTKENSYAKVFPGDKTDEAIENAVMWGDNLHYSINDAIDALRQKQLILDASEANGTAGIDAIFGGYKVSSKETDENATPALGYEDIPEDYVEGVNETANNTYSYKTENELALGPAKDKNGNDVTSNYTLTDAKRAVNAIGRAATALGKDLRVDVKGNTSNRAIYIKVDGSVDTAAGAYIYLLHNVNYKKLSTDKAGIFKFADKKGNKLYYQDKIFKGIEYLALVILGDKGLIYVVNRHGGKNCSKVAWMINENGYASDTQTKVLVDNGLIHTTSITINDETFEATCTVSGLKVHKTKKITNRYVPVLFLDTLKVSTIEQTGQSVYATGGRGNSNLIGWDYGKEITLTLQDALFTPASMSAIFGSYEGTDFRNGVKEAKTIDRMEKCTAKRNFIVPAGNQNGTPAEADQTAQAVFYDPRTMEPYQDGTPIAEGEVFYKFTRSIAYEGQSIGNVIEISADKFPGTYKIVGDTYVRAENGGEDQRFQFIIPKAKMTSDQTITLEADGDPAVFDMNLTVLRPEDGIMVKFVQYDVIENKEENDGSTMVKNTENLNLLDDAELFRVNGEGQDDEAFIGATEY